MMALKEITVDEKAVSSSSPIDKEPQRKWVSYIWDTFDKSPEERRLLSKLDAVVLGFASLAYFVKNIDQVNINSAFVSGMKEDLGLYKNELNYMQAAWTVGYVVGEIPSNMLLTRIRPRYWLPTMEVIWTVLTFSLSRCNKPMQFYILRFFIGLAESTYYPGMQYIIGSWYRRDELAKRACMLHMSNAFANMVSGYLAMGVYNLGGVGGFKGWQWLFIVNGVISLPIALCGYFLIPDVPEIANPWYLSDKEVALACTRMELEGRKNREPLSRLRLKKIFSSWHIYFLVVLYVSFVNISGGQPIFQQYLKSSTDPVYTVSQINAYPTITYAVQVVITLIYGWTSDTILKGRRWPPIIFAGVMNLICYIPLAIWTIPDQLKWACYILAGIGYGISGICMAWAQEICSRDNEERALVVGSMAAVSQAFQAWLPQVVWQQVDGPQYHKGYITSIVMSVIMMITVGVVRNLQLREDKKRKDQEETVTNENASE